ncbi:MAG: paraquat-inducible membrane protein A [Desulfuromonas sp.]|uniref:paraquat-inducible protein A n=1 Tax=Desulfuromonas sp. TaxID=892 RepID=UPI000CB45314|nr:paraquat-inducible protein A [Desulfuromonas sp.]PLX85056.1 MAG: paraquat-inducible membrane protein A [Desulfuromonas sp.]
MNRPLASARQLGLVLCHDCHLVVRQPSLIRGQSALCPRCGAALHQRKPNSLARTRALLIASFIFYIPANVLPITISSTLGSEQADTIMSGVIYFIKSGSWEIAAVIFIASVFVPLMKLMILTSLLLSVQFKSQWRPKERTQLYRMTEAVGRWSMVDIYVVTILVALVKLGALANVDAGPAAVYFAAVVVITMFAAESFDPRLIWDALEEKHG